MHEFQGILIIMVVVWVFGKLFRAIRLPVLFGELLGGIIVGPLVFGLVNPDSESVKVLAEFGIFFLMLHAGLETDPKQLLKASKKSLIIAIVGLLVPFISTYFLARAFGSDVNESLFLGIGVSISAIAITVRLFKDYKIQNTSVARITLGAAIFTDIFALMIFSVLLGIVETGEFQIYDALVTIIKMVLFFGIVIYTGFKTSKHLANILKDKGFTFALIVALGLGLFAEYLGLHVIIGAFLAGLFIREEVLDKKVFNKIEDRIYGLSYSFLGPIFFTSLAFHLDFSAVISRPYFLISVFVVAVVTKILSTMLTALAQKMSTKHSLIIGLTMNSRGAVDLVIASIGLQLGVISEEVFSIIVIMAFLTTIFAIFSVKPFVKYAKHSTYNNLTSAN